MIVFGLGLGIASHVLIMLTFLKAFFHESKTTRVTVNDYGEANIEFVLIFVVLFVMLLGYYYALQGVKKGGE